MSKINKIELNNFRVYRNQKFEVDPDVRIILLYGNNGFGKTSFFDGIEWALTGSIQRYSNSSRERNDYDVLRNTLSKSEERSFVKITFDDGQVLERIVKYKANKDYNEGVLKSKNSVEDMFISNDYKGKISFVDSFCFSQFLSQELINRFIREMKDTERYDSIKSILGLHRHEMYETFIKNIDDYLKIKLKQLQERRAEIKKEIEIANAKKTNINLEEKVLGLRLNKLFNNDIIEINSKLILSRLNERNAVITNRYEELEKDQKSINLKIIDLEELTLDKFKEHELNKKELDNVRRKIKTNNSIAHNIEKFEKIKYLRDNFETYIGVTNSNFDNSINQALSDKKINISRIEGIGRNIEDAIKYFEAENIDLDIVNDYKVSIREVEKISNYLANKEKELKQIMSLKQEFINTTLEYLKGNLNLKKCPVCKQTFDLYSTINQLNEELDNNSDNYINKLVKEIKNGRLRKEKEQNMCNRYGETLLNKLNNIKILLVKEVEILAKEITETEKNERFRSDYIKKLSSYGIGINEIESDFKKYQNIYQSLGQNNDIAFYSGLKEALEKEEKHITKIIGEFRRLLEKNNVSNYEETKRSIYELKEKLNTQLNKMDKVKVEKQEIEELISHYKNNIHNSKLKELGETKYKINSAISNYEILSESFNNLRANSRKVMLNEIDRILKSDELPIKTMYNYLNPNYNFDSLNFRVDNSNPKNNRLILEAVSENGAKINPAYSFSSAQNNVLAVSIFLSIALSQNWSKLKSIFMDDPIQNMDDINITNFVDIMRNIIKNTDRQIFLSTHDKRIFEFMNNKYGKQCQTFVFNDYGLIE